MTGRRMTRQQPTTESPEVNPLAPNPKARYRTLNLLFPKLHEAPNLPTLNREGSPLLGLQGRAVLPKPDITRNPN